MSDVMKSILATVGATLFLGLASLAVSRCRKRCECRTVYQWLRKNTQDEPGQSHASTVSIANGTGLPERRVREACFSDKRIYRASGDADQWSVWRKEPQSVYEKHGIIFL